MNAFSSREPASTSHENALAQFGCIVLADLMRQSEEQWAFCQA